MDREMDRMKDRWMSSFYSVALQFGYLHRELDDPGNPKATIWKKTQWLYWPIYTKLKDK